MIYRDEIKFGIIGFGGAGRAHWSYISCVPGCRVTKVYDPKPQGRQRALDVNGPFQVFSSLDNFWKDLDAVSICTPDSTHADLIVRALGEGLHVVCEKPLTDSIEGIIKIRKAQRESSRVVGVLHQMRFVPVHKAAKRILSEGVLGKLFYLEGH